MPNGAFIAYCAAIFVASMIPGPSMLLALTQGARFGLGAGMLGGFGNLLASLLQALVAFLLLFEVGRLSGQALAAIRIVGAIYIIYLGIRLLGVKSFFSGGDSPAVYEKRSRLRHFRDGFAFAIANPKAITFFAALFPQFVQGQGWQWSVLFTVFLPIASIALGCYLIYVMAGLALVRLFDRAPHVGYFFGAAIILAGVALLFQ
jgi:threonine/homoserine/homoserine lactone efflux protein